jgi:hypothetical protein
MYYIIENLRAYLKSVCCIFVFDLSSSRPDAYITLVNIRRSSEIQSELSKAKGRNSHSCTEYLSFADRVCVRLCVFIGMYIGRRFFPPNQPVFNSGGAGMCLYSIFVGSPPNHNAFAALFVRIHSG